MLRAAEAEERGRSTRSSPSWGDGVRSNVDRADALRTTVRAYLAELVAAVSPRA